MEAPKNKKLQPLDLMWFGAFALFVLVVAYAATKHDVISSQCTDEAHYIYSIERTMSRCSHPDHESSMPQKDILYCVCKERNR